MTYVWTWDRTEAHDCVGGAEVAVKHEEHNIKVTYRYCVRCNRMMRTSK